MRLTLVAVGSRGDIQPLIALGRELARFGHQVRLAGFPRFSELVRRHGLEFAQLRWYGASEEDQRDVERWLRSGGDPIRYWWHARSLQRGNDDRFFGDLWNACRDAQVIIASA